MAVSMTKPGSELPPGVLAHDVERYVLGGEGGRRLEGRGELSLGAGGRVVMLDADGGVPFSLKLARAGEDGAPQGGFTCAWVRGSREILVSVAGQASCFALVVHDGAVPMDKLAAALGAAILPPSEPPAAAEPPAVVLLAASAIEGTGKVAATVLTGGASLIGAGMGLALQTFKTNVGSNAEPVVLSDGVHALIDTTHSAASAAEELTGGVRNGLRSVATTVGRGAADSITRAAPLAGSSASMLGASAVALGGASAAALGHVFGAIETSTMTVVGATSSAASGAIGHCYGSDAEAAAKQVGGSVQKAARAALNVGSFGVRSLARATARQAVQGVGDNLQHARGAVAGSHTPGAAAEDGGESHGRLQM